MGRDLVKMLSLTRNALSLDLSSNQHSSGPRKVRYGDTVVTDSFGDCIISKKLATEHHSNDAAL